MTGVTSKGFDQPDERRTPPKGVVDVVELGDAKVARLTLEPGWRWAESIKPIAGTDSCQIRHLGLSVAGTIHVRHDDGTELEIHAGQAYAIEPGHDAWVVGDESFIGYEFEGVAATEFARD